MRLAVFNLHGRREDVWMYVMCVNAQCMCTFIFTKEREIGKRSVNSNCHILRREGKY